MTAALASMPENQQSLRDIAVQLFDDLAKATGDGVGITRECFAEGENYAIELFRAMAEAHGLVTSSDTVANLVMSLPGDDGSKPALYLGSHADSVPQGGNYDGAAGVVSALLCLIRLRREGIEPPSPVRAICLRAEESAFYGRANIGSRALFGLLDTEDLDAKCRGKGRSLRAAMESAGIPVERVAARERLFDRAAASGYLELHIEQGPVMIARDLATAIVTGIRGNIRHRKITCRGDAGHSGAIPRWLRKDAVFAFADLIMRLDEHWRVLQERGLDLVVTTGIVGTDPDEHAISRIPGEVDFSFEVRSQSHDTLEAFYELFRSECRAVAAQRTVRFEFDHRVYTEPARMDEGMIRRLVGAAGRAGLPAELLPSGAGHDAAVFANEGIPSGMIFVRNANGSHNPAEAMEIDDFMKGFELMYAAVSGES
jgi:N-carbamoyl-L-amino-acid hydrolase